MSFTITLTNGNVFAVIPPNTINQSSSMTLIGDHYVNYGAFLDQNYIRLLENGANSVAPSAPLTGQLWFNTTLKTLEVYNGTTFKSLSGSQAASSAPTGNAIGDLWYDTINQQLNVWTGSQWLLVGPAYNSAQGITGALPATIVDNSSVSHTVIELYVANTVVGFISSSASFTPQTAISGFTTISPGITLSTLVGNSIPLFTGTATNSQQFNGLSSTQFMRSDANTSTTGSISAVGNIAGNYFIGNGSLLTGISGGGNVNYSNANTASFLAAFGSNTISTTGSITSGNITSSNVLTGGIVSATGNISGNFILGNGAFLTGISGGGNVNYSNSNVSSFLAAFGSNTISTIGTITSGNISGSNILTTGLVSASGTITGSSHIGTVVSASGNITGANLLTGGTVSATGNIAGNYFIGNGSLLTGISGSGNVNYSNSNVSSFLAAFGSNTISTTGSITSGNISGSNILTAGQLSATGNISGNFILGNGYYLSGLGNGSGNINYSNSNVSGFLAAFGSNTISTTGSITSGNHSISGNITFTGGTQGSAGSGPKFLARFSGSPHSSRMVFQDAVNPGLPMSFGIAPANATGGSNYIAYANSDPDNSAIGIFTAIPSSSISIQSLGTANGINSGSYSGLPLTFSVAPAGEIARFTNTGNLLVGNTTDNGGKLQVSGNISATGNIAGSYILGNGAFLTGISGGSGNANYSNSNVSSFLAAFGSNTISTTGSISSGLHTLSANISFTGGTQGSANSGSRYLARFSGAPHSSRMLFQDAANPGLPMSFGIAPANAVGGSNYITYANSDTDNSAIGIFTSQPGSQIAIQSLGTSGGTNSGSYSGLPLTFSVSPQGEIARMLNNGHFLVGTSTDNGNTFQVNGSISGGNVLTGGVVSASGNITGSYILGNGAYLTGISGGGGSTYGDSNVSSLLSAFGSNTISTTGSISSGLHTISGNISFTGGTQGSAGSGPRLLARFDGSPHSSRFMFQGTTSSSNPTAFGILPPPNGANGASFFAYGSPDPDNSPFGQLGCSQGGGTTGISSAGTSGGTVSGSFSGFPINFYITPYGEVARFVNNGNFLINTTGDLGSGYNLQVNGYAVANNFFTFSDYRLKENVKTVSGALNKVLKLNPVTFTWKKTGKSGVGFIAHELQQVLPQSVTGIKDEKNAAGSPLHQLVEASSATLIATLTAAIQELNTKVVELEAKLKSAGVNGF